MVWPADAAQKQESRTDRTVYMAPEEQAGGNLGDPRSDVYSLGMCALYSLLGKELTPAMVMDRATLIEQLDAPPPLKAVLLRAVAPNPNDRFPTVAEFCRALEFDAPALPGMVTRASLPGVPAGLTRTNPGLMAPGVRQSSPQMPVMAPLSRTNPPINPSLTRTNPGLFGGQAPPLTSPAKPAGVRTTGPQPLAGARPVTPPPPAANLRTTNPPPAANLLKTNPPMPGLTRTQPPPPVRVTTGEEEIQPPPGRSAGEVAEYAIDTERVRAVTAEAMTSRNPNSVMQPLPTPPPRKQWPLMVGFGALVLVGGVGLGTYLVNSTRKPVVAVTEPVVGKETPAGPNGAAAVHPVEPGSEDTFVATPIIPVKPGEVASSKNKHDADSKAHSAQAAAKVAAKTDAESAKHADAKATQAAPAKAVAGADKDIKDSGEKVAQRPSLMKSAAQKAEPVKPPEHKPLLAKTDAVKADAGKPVAQIKPEPAKVVAAVKPEPAKPVAQAKLEPAKVAQAKPEPAKPVAAVKVDAQKLVAQAKLDAQKPMVAAKPDPLKLAAAKPEPAKAVAAAKPVVAVKPVAVAKVEPAKPVAKPIAAYKPMPVKPMVAQAKPAPSAQATPEGQAALRDAQLAFVRGDRQQALAMALGVTRRGGEDAASAWRFVGGAACSNRQAALATTAYRNLKSPDARKTLVDLCQRNGVPFAGGQFSSD